MNLTKVLPQNLSIMQFSQPKCLELSGKTFRLAMDNGFDTELTFTDETCARSAADGEPFLFRRALRHECRGEDVRALKRLLARAGFGGLDPENPNFYGNTKRTVLAFQRKAGLEPDGVAGKKTIAALGGRAQF